MFSVETRQVAVRLSLEVIERIDAYSKRVAPEGVQLSRSDTIRILLERGLKAAEEQQ